MTIRPQQTHGGAREQLRRAVEDGERLYRKRMHDPDGDGLPAEDEYRIDGILTRELESALGLVDALLARLEQAERALVAHHAIHNLSDEMIAESLGGACQVCARAQVTP